MRCKFSILILLLLIFPAFSNAVATTLYTQPTQNGGAVADQNDPGGIGAFATPYDDFTLATSAQIQTVEWNGSFSNPPVPGSISQFAINIYSNVGGQPGQLLYSTVISGNGGQTQTGSDIQGTAVYGYTGSVNFAADGGTEYWISIVPNLVFPPQWGWELGVGPATPAGGSYVDIYSQRSHEPFNDAFTLEGTPQAPPPTVPEPSSFVMLGTGVLGMVGAVRRRMC